MRKRAEKVVLPVGDRCSGRVESEWAFHDGKVHGTNLPDGMSVFSGEMAFLLKNQDMPIAFFFPSRRKYPPESGPIWPLCLRAPFPGMFIS